MASNSKKSRTIFSVEEMVEMCCKSSNEDGSDIDSETGGMSSEEEDEIDRELLFPSDIEIELR